MSVAESPTRVRARAGDMKICSFDPEHDGCHERLKASVLRKHAPSHILNLCATQIAPNAVMKVVSQQS